MSEPLKNTLAFLGAASGGFLLNRFLHTKSLSQSSRIALGLSPSAASAGLVLSKASPLSKSIFLGTLVGATGSLVLEYSNGVGVSAARSHLSFKQGPPLASLVKRTVKLPAQHKVVVKKYSLTDNRAEPDTIYFWDSEAADGSVNDWYPASTVKFVAAMGASKRLGDLGFSPDSTITFLDKGSKPYVIPYRNLLKSALVDSDNIHYDRLVQVAGHKNLHDYINVMYPTLVFNRPYLKDQWQALTGSREFDSPVIFLKDVDGKTIELAAETHIEPSAACPNRSSCGSLIDYSSAVADLVLFPENTRLKPEHINAIIQQMSTPKSRGRGLMDGVLSKRHFPEWYHKPGFAIDYFSDAALFVDRDNKVAYAISAMGFPGRDSLDDIAQAIGELIADGSI